MNHLETRKRARLYAVGRWPLWLVLAVLLSAAPVTRAQTRPEGATASSGSRSQTSETVVNLNTATEQELIDLPGIGPSKAKAILELRKRMGKFERVENLLRVRGIGRKTLRRLAPMLSVKDAPETRKKPRTTKSTTRPPAGATR